MRFIQAGCLVTLLYSLALPARAAGGGYEIAFTPFLPVRTLVQNYQPMLKYLERELSEAVTFVSAPDYRTDNARIGAHEYSFIITVANSAYLAHADHGYVPMLRPTIPTRPTLVVRKDSPVTSIKGLPPQAKVAMSDPLAIVSMQGMLMLREAGLSPATEVSVAHYANHLTAVNVVISGEAAAAVVSDRALHQMPAAVRNQVRQVVSWNKGAAPGVVYLASPEVPTARRERLTQAVVKFTQTPEGRALMEQWGYGGLVPMTAREFKPLEPYGARLRAALRAD